VPSSLELGQYKLLKRLAAGGMGEVYVGVRTGIGDFEKPLAIKLLLPHLSDDASAVGRFLDEARLSARMNHPNIAQVFDVGLVDERYFIAMELVRGASLSQLIKALKLMKLVASPAVISWVGRSLCDGLQHAHTLTIKGEAQHVVHRDVTPHNVLISTDGVVKLTDFGVARMRMQSGATGVGKVIGKLSYMPPEQLRGVVDERADLFGIGATLFHLATLDRPFEAGSSSDPITGFHERRLRNLAELRPDLPARLVAAIQHALEADREKRPASARAMRDELPEWGAGQEELATLIRTTCAAVVDQVDELTRRSGQERTPEVAVSGPAERLNEASAPGRTSARGRALAIGALLGVLSLALGWAVVSSRSSNHTDAPPIIEITKPPPISEPGGAAPPLDVEEPTRDAPVVDLTAPPERIRPKAPRPRVDAPSPAKAPALGFLFVTAEPWAYVYVDGERIGETPLAAVPVTAGVHRVRLVNPETKREHQQTIRVRDGERVYSKASLR